MNYKSFADLSTDIKSNLHKIPKDVSLVVGIPRSGLLAANFISVYLNLPLTDIDSFIQGKIVAPSLHKNLRQDDAYKGKILVVDDSVATGKAIVDARQKLEALVKDKHYQLIYCCIYAEPGRKEMVDIPLMLLDRPRLFEWNIFHNSILGKACVELEGVLCQPYNQTENKEWNFDEYISKVQPNFIPKSNIAVVTTTRPEKYREKTEQWLNDNGIKYTELLMAIQNEADSVRFKALIYKRRKKLELFLEGSKVAAQRIFEITGKDVYCLESNEMLTKMTYKKLSFKIKRQSIYFFRDFKKSVLKPS